MSELKNVSVSIKANVYFSGKVTSRTMFLGDGSKITLGIILPGEYTFPVGDREVVKITAGVAEVLLPAEKNWKKVNCGEEFIVIANSEYQIKCREVTEYLCYYVKE